MRFTDAEWQPTPDQPAIELFKLDSNGKQILPEGQPEIVRPQFDLRQSFDDIKKNVSKMRSFISHEQNEWWEQLFDNPEGLLSQTDDWFWDWIRPHITDTPQPSNLNVESPLQFAMERERSAVTNEYTSPNVRDNKRKQYTPNKRSRSKIELAACWPYRKETKYLWERYVKLG